VLSELKNRNNMYIVINDNKQASEQMGIGITRNIGKLFTNLSGI